jgi:hypothetical protein
MTKAPKLLDDGIKNIVGAIILVLCLIVLGILHLIPH